MGKIISTLTLKQFYLFWHAPFAHWHEIFWHAYSAMHIIPLEHFASSSCFFNDWDLVMHISSPPIEHGQQPTCCKTQSLSDWHVSFTTFSTGSFIIELFTAIIKTTRTIIPKITVITALFFIFIKQRGRLKIFCIFWISI